MKISEAMALCHKNNIRIAGEKSGAYFYVLRNDKRYEKPLSSKKELNEAVEQTYFFYAKKLIEQAPKELREELGEQSE